MTEPHTFQAAVKSVLQNAAEPAAASTFSESHAAEHLVHWWATRPQPEEWAQELAPYLKSTTVGRWIREIGRTRSSDGLQLLRQWRALQFFDAATNTLLVGWPVVMKSTEKVTGAAFWRQLAAQLDAGLSHALLPEGATAKTMPCLWDVDSLVQAEDQLAASWLTDDASLAQGEQFPALTSSQALRACGRALLLTRVTVDSPDVLEKVFFSFNAVTSKTLGRLTLRLEAWLEEQGVHVKLLPATAVWNAFSLARIAHARYVLGLLAKQGRLIKVTFDKAQGFLHIQTREGETLELPLPEESEEALAPLISKF